MIVAFPFSFMGPLQEIERETAKLFIESLRRWPGIRIVQVSDENTAEVSGIDECFRYYREGNLGTWYFRAFSEFPYERFLRLDYDCMILSDVSAVMDQEYDLAIAKEDKAGVLNNGVVFVHERRAFVDGLHAYERTGMNGWGDMQVAMQEVIDGGRYRVKKLDHSYNTSYDPGLAVRPKILHFKGGKKKVMKEETERFLNIVPKERAYG